MNLLAHLLYRLTANRPTRLIKISGQAYLERYFLCQVLGITVYLHRFVRDDKDRALHNHPWKHAISLVLTGGYTEHQGLLMGRTPDGIDTVLTTVKPVKWFNHIRHSSHHQIVRVKPETWTLFMHTRRRFEWGFLERLTGPLPHYRYRKHIPEQPRQWWRTAPPAKRANREPFGG